ncbi:Hypothetical predicted protein, partial [Lynx pardinus]
MWSDVLWVFCVPRASAVVFVPVASSLARAPPLAPELLGIREDVHSGVATGVHNPGYKTREEPLSHRDRAVRSR